MGDLVEDAPVGPSPSPVRPPLGRSTTSEWTLFATLGVLCAFTAAIIGVLTSPKWEATTASIRIWFLGWMGLLAVGGNLVLIVAICSPWMGKVSASAAGAEIDVEGRS